MFPSGENIDVEDTKNIDELSGNLGSDETGLMHSVMESDKKIIDEGHLIIDSINQGIFSFNPDMIYEHLVKDYNMSKKLYGETFLREITGEDSESLRKNLKFPEYQRQLKKKIKDKIEGLKDNSLINKEGSVTEKGIELAGLTLYFEELDNLKAKGLIGERVNKKFSLYGEKYDSRLYKKGDRYKDIDIKGSVKRAVRRKHSKLEINDINVFRKESKGKIYLVYALDASGSMRGEKIKLCKKAGIALAYKAIQEKDEVGLLVFGSGVENRVRPTHDFNLLLKEIINIRAKKETDIASTIKEAIELFPNENATKHLIVITDGLPTVGVNPEKETLDAVGEAVFAGITISVIGVNLDEEGEDLVRKMSEIGNGKLYIIKNLENLDQIVLQDYYSLN